MVEAERIGRARREHRDLAEEAAHRRLGLGREILVVERQPAGRVVLRHRPDDRRAVAARIVGHRQQRERAGRIENLIGDMVVRQLVAEHRDDRLMVVFPARDADPGRLARRANCGRRRRPAAARESLRPSSSADDHAMLAAIDARSTRDFHSSHEILARLGARAQRGAQMAVLVHPAERLVVVGIELQPARLEPVGDRDAADRAARLGADGRRPRSSRACASSSTRPRWCGRRTRRRCAASGSAGSTTIAERPLESSAEASARPTSPPPKMITSARSMRARPNPLRRNDATKFA